MKKFLGTVVLCLLLSTTSFAGVKKGKGEVKMTNQSIDRFIQYIRGKKGQKPMAFILSNDGVWSTYWYCGHAAGCRDGTSYGPTIRECERATGTDCGLFARRYTILWKNGINPGKGNESKIRMKWSDDQIRAKLTELGFIGGETSLNKQTDSLEKVDLPTHKISWEDGERKEQWIEMMTGGTEMYKTWADAISTKTTFYSFGWYATDDGVVSSAKGSTKNCEDFRNKKKSKYNKHDLCIVYFINGLPTSDEEKIKFANKFYGTKRANLAFENNPSLLEKLVQNKKIVKKYELKGERPIALSWDGYENLIAGTIKFNESDYKGTLNLPLPNNDGICDGNYSLQEGGKGTWQIACTNNMGAAGTLKWNEVNGVTGTGRDHNDKKVKFTVAGNG